MAAISFQGIRGRLFWYSEQIVLKMISLRDMKSCISQMYWAYPALNEGIFVSVENGIIKISLKQNQTEEVASFLRVQ